MAESPNSSGERPWHGPFHWESWLVRATMLATFAVQWLIVSNRSGAIVAAEGLAVSLFPLVQRFSRTHVPRAMEFVFVLAMALQFLSESTKLFEHYTYWDKIVHPSLIALTTMLVAWMLLGYRVAFSAQIPTQLVAAVSILFGAALGGFWEFIEFFSDWFSNAGLQKSNADTNTDMLCNTIGAFIATLVGLWIFGRWIGRNQAAEMGRVGHWLVHGLGTLLEQRGRIVGTLAAAAFAFAIGAALWIDRSPPALAAGASSSGASRWRFTAASALPPTLTLLGFWQPDPKGLCRLNNEDPLPGAEKEGLIQIEPGSRYGADGLPFSLTARYFEERPPVVKGSQMTAGIAFGIQDAKNYYVLEESALHDILRLSRYVHGNRRDVREKLYRTQGNEWHVLGVRVKDAQVTAAIDGKDVYAVSGLRDTSGGIGLWAIATSTSCFSDLSVEVNRGS